MRARTLVKMNPRRIAFWMLAVAGVALGHIMGYAVAHPGAAAREAALGGHAYLPVTASVVVPLGVATALVWAIRTARSMGMAGEIRFSHLALAQVAVFAVQEVGERMVSGAGAAAALGERGVWFGIVAQVLVAFLITRSVDLVRRVARFVTGGRRLVLDRPLPASPLVLRAVLVSSPAAVAVGLRAPPRIGSLR